MLTNFTDQSIEHPILESLNPGQREAASTTEGPLLVLAGAGTGKTRVLTSRIAYILSCNMAFPSQILAVTFTNKAAREMRERVASLVGEQMSAGLWLGTFHSICLKIIRRHAEQIGLKPDFSVIDTDDQLRLLKQILADNNLDEKKYPVKAIAATIQRWKDRGYTPEKVRANEEASPVLFIYELYQKRLLLLNATDFGDLLLHCITLFTKYPETLEEYHRRFRYILVDEYQDTNVAQYLWLRLLAQKNHNICCVGDDDQSIYGWRGAEVENILRFSKDFADGTGNPAKIIRLEQNYRSTPQILATASAVISNNRDRLGKTLFSDKDGGSNIKVVSLWDERAEANYVGQEIEALQQVQKHKLEDIAVLVRAGFQTRSFEECFISMAIPYRVIGGLRFYERLEIRDAIAYIRAVLQPSNDLALERIVNTPKRGIGKATIEEIRKFATDNNLSLSDSVRKNLENRTLKPKIYNTLELLFRNFDKWKNLFTQQSHHEVVGIILKESGYLEMWKNEKTPEAEGRVENLNELITALEEFENIEQFLEHVSLVMDGDEAADADMVSIMTMHGAKGLEFETVYLTGWEEGLFPSQKSMDENGSAGLEEERRLAYVGITRAKKNLTITFASNRRVYGQWLTSIPSRFIDELPQDTIEMINTGAPAYRAQPVKTVWLPSQSKMSTGLGEKQNNFMNPVTTVANTQKFALGERIFHQKFGYGKIIEIAGSHIKISFEKAGVKTLMEEYIQKIDTL